MTNQLQLIFQNTSSGKAAMNTFRLYMIAMYLVGACIIVLGRFMPDPDPSDRFGLGIIATCEITIALVLVFYKNISPNLLRFFLTLGIIIISGCVALSKPLGNVPVFYIWSILLASYYLPRKGVIFNYGVFYVSFALVLFFFGDEGTRLQEFIFITGAIGVVAVVVVTLREQLQKAAFDLQIAATHDSLTGALNRAAFEKHLGDAADKKTGYSLAVLDLDYFKNINDQYGHSTGDQALKDLVALISSQVRAGDIFARIGGEEFALVLPDCAIDDAVELCEKLRLCIASQKKEPTFTVSIGVVRAENDAPDRVLSAADEALYVAKHAGRNNVAVGKVSPTPVL